MFGLVRKSKYDALARRCDEADAQLSQIMFLCHQVGCGGGEMKSPYRLVKELIDRVYVAASTVAAAEKIDQFNRGMLAEREAAKSRHAA